MQVLQIIKSLLSAIFGVRSQKEAEEDFKQIDYRWYVFFAVMIVLVIIGLLALVVKIVIKTA